MVASPDLNGEACHVFWHMATDADDLLQNLRAARALSERSPLSGYASIGRDELQALLIVSQRVDRAHGTGYHARVRRLREAVPARAADDGRGRDRREGRPRQAARRPGRPRPLPARRRAARRRHRRARRQGAHVRARWSRTSSWSSRSAPCGRRTPTTPWRSRSPVDTPGIKLDLPRLLRREPGRVRGARLEPRRPDGVVHDLRRRLRPVGARVPVRRGGVRRRGGEHVREREPAGLSRRGRRQAAAVHRRRAAGGDAERRHRRGARRSRRSPR